MQYTEWEIIKASKQEIALVDTNQGYTFNKLIIVLGRALSFDTVFKFRWRCKNV